MNWEKIDAFWTAMGQNLQVSRARQHTSPIEFEYQNKVYSVDIADHVDNAAYSTPVEFYRAINEIINSLEPVPEDTYGYFLVTLTQHDGEHEHAYDFIAKGIAADVRKRIAFEQLYDYEGHPNSKLDFGDGTTTVSKFSLKQIPIEHFNFLRKNKYFQEI